MTIVSMSIIKKFPSTLESEREDKRWHESIFRSYHILEKVKELLELNTPASVILEIIEEIESAEQTVKRDE